jgi:hypothetical protein
MKKKPVFKNTGKGRIQIVQQGIPIWMNPGDTIIGEKYRAFLSLGLEEVGRDALPKITKPASKPVVNDPEPAKAPVKVREMKVVDHVLPMDDMKVEIETTPPEPDPEPEVVDIEPMDPPEDEEPELALHLTGQGDELKDEIVADILKDLDDEDDLVIIADDDDDLELPEPDDYPFKCDQCDRAFASQRGLKSHSRVHKD